MEEKENNLMYRKSMSIAPAFHAELRLDRPTDVFSFAKWALLGLTRMGCRSTLTESFWIFR